MEFETNENDIIINKYVYRSLTIEKLIDFFETCSIYLSRLYLFEDIENIDPYDINELKLLILTKLPKCESYNKRKTLGGDN